MSLKKNILVSYISQLYGVLIGIVMVPLYIKYMGAEAYGLVGFFAMLQAWFSLLDMGLTPTITRETARYRGGAIDSLVYRRLVRALEMVFLVLAIVGGAAMFILSDYIAHDWLQASMLPIGEVQVAVQLMSLSVALRWMGGLYRGTISGSERLVWLSVFNSAMATFRFVGVLPLLIFVGSTPTIFFSFQFALALMEFVVLLIYAYQLLPTIPAVERTSWDWTPLKPVLKFSMSIAFTSSVWVLVTQTDKLVLSKILPLAEYGYFTLAVLVSSGVMVISGPISNALMPRMAKLEAEGDHARLIEVYRQATQLVSVIAGSASITLAFCAEPLLWAWTGDQSVAQQTAPILALYALGNGILAVAAFPYYLQYAKGDLHLHLIGNLVFVVLLTPLIVLATSKFGSIGAGYVWLGMNLLSFVAWLPLVHSKFEPGLNRSWYCQDVLYIIFSSLIAGYIMRIAMPQSENRLLQFLEVVITGIFIFTAGAGASSAARKRVKHWLVSGKQRIVS